MGPPMLKSFRARARPLMDQWFPSLAATVALGTSYWLHFSRLRGRLDRVDSAVHGIAAQAREVIATKVACEPAAPVSGLQFTRPRLSVVCLPLVATVLGAAITTGSRWWNRFGLRDLCLPSRRA